MANSHFTSWIRCGAACLISTAIVSAVPAPGVAQRQPAVSASGRWLPRDVHTIQNLTAAQRTEAMGTLDRIERILKQLPELANPDGFEIQPIFDGGGQHLAPGVNGAILPGSVVEYSLGLMHFNPTRAIAGEGRSCVVVTVNKRSQGSLYDAQGRLIYIEGDRAKPSTNPNIADGRVPHATQVFGELWNVPRERSFATVAFVTAGELPWKQVTREEFYQANLFDQEGANGEKQAGVRESLTKTPYQEWIEGAEQRRKDREQTFRELTGIVSAAEIAKMRQAQESSEREVTENLKKNEAQNRVQNSDALNKSFASRNAMLAELAAMTPAERRMPAYINNALTQGPIATGWRLTVNEAPPAWRVLTPNYDFWRARRSPAEVRTITVDIGVSGTCLAPKIQNAMWQAYHKLDWAAFNNLLVQPRP